AVGSFVAGLMGFSALVRVGVGLLLFLSMSGLLFTTVTKAASYIWINYKAVVALLALAILGAILSVVPMIRSRAASSTAVDQANTLRIQMSQQIGDTVSEADTLTEQNRELEGLLEKRATTVNELVRAVESNDQSAVDGLVRAFKEQEAELQRLIDATNARITDANERIASFVQTNAGLSEVADRLRTLRDQLLAQKKRLEEQLRQRNGQSDGEGGSSSKTKDDEGGPSDVERILAFLLTHGLSEILGLFNDEELKKEVQAAAVATHSGHKVDLDALLSEIDDPVVKLRLLTYLEKVATDSKNEEVLAQVAKHKKGVIDGYHTSLPDRAKALDKALETNPSLSLKEIKGHILQADKFYSPAEKLKILELLELRHPAAFETHREALAKIPADGGG
ncbi:MAG: hypothetical protein SFV81_28845, partial [Pirellulaceae bacterium]|nr:hypothetical protein [Pirellulaceae bacterium]